MYAPTPWPPTNPRRSGSTLLALAAAHLGLIWLLFDALRQQVPAAASRQTAGFLVRLITPLASPRVQASPTADEPHRPLFGIQRDVPQESNFRRAADLSAAPADAAGVPISVIAPASSAEAISAGAAEPVAPSASPAAHEPLLQTAATRRALREAGRQPLLSERADAATGIAPPASPEAKRGAQIQQGATTECLKGEFAGGGAGLLSLPFWALAEARGKCRR